MNYDFTGPALAAGTVLGVRAFDIDSLGRLRGVTHADVFRPPAHAKLLSAIIGTGVACSDEGLKCAR